jgi:two-component system sensor histidine kinase BaeS
MRLRQFQHLFLMNALATLVAVVAMATVMSLSLSQGFADYLASRDREQLDAFVVGFAQDLAARGGVAAIRDGRITLRFSVEELRRKGDLDDARPAPASSWGRGQPEDHPPPERFEARLRILDAQGRYITGPPLLSGDDPRNLSLVERIVQVDGVSVARVQLVPRGRLPPGVEQGFLDRQYRIALILVPILLLLAAMPAFWIARRLAIRFDAMSVATTTIARGDFTPRIAVQGGDELAEMARNINSMAESLATLDSSRRRWLAEISHELRTPLASLVGELEALRDRIRPLNEAALESLAEEAQILSRIVSDLHFLALTDLASPTCLYRSTDAVQIVQRVAGRLAPMFDAAGLSFTVDVSFRESLVVVWDAERIEQLLTNLLMNSVRYTNAPGRVQLSLERVGDRVRIAVEDSAPGVSAEHRQRLFEPLYRVDVGRSRLAGGSGLGLAVCHAIVQGHRGRIEVNDSVLGGLLIEVELPLDCDSA